LVIQSGVRRRRATSRCGDVPQKLPVEGLYFVQHATMRWLGVLRLRCAPLRMTMGIGEPLQLFSHTRITCEGWGFPLESMP
jgi:hypothetical protein